MKKIFKIFLFTTCILVSLIACKSIKKHSYYYDFDEVVHYKTDIDELELLNIRSKKVKTVRDSMMLTMAWNYYRVPLARAVTYLDSIDFKKQLILSSKIPGY